MSNYAGPYIILATEEIQIRSLPYWSDTWPHFNLWNFRWNNIQTEFFEIQLQNHLTDLFEIQIHIQAWYQNLSEKIQHQSRVDEYQVSEQTRIYHHELHRRHLKKSSILKLETEEGVIEVVNPLPDEWSQTDGVP